MHAYFNARDLSIFIFPLTYLPVGVFVMANLYRIRVLNLFLMAYCLLIMTRMLCIFILPFCEPEDAIPLNDYLLNTFFYPRGYCALDLFYSGHTATLFLLTLIVPKPWKFLLLALTLILATLVVWQKVHYTVDVLAALP
ncbi:MAG TPA: phosphatase PAP2-related protein, partial [Flavobacteriales bacterium]|nr:phosphatase PAP2-related protein [Flavobacteriales bacterium]